MKKKVLTCCFITLGSLFALQAQVGINTETPDPSAILDVVGNNGGLLLPRINSTANITNPAKGLIIYNTTTNTLQMYSGSNGNEQWKDIGASTNIATPDWFYMPVFTLNLSVTTLQSINLYNKYKEQTDAANAQGAGIKLYNKDEINFYLAGYDAGAFINPTITNNTTTGAVLSFQANPTSVSSGTYINIIVKVIPK